jgi:hypothetical protein
MVRWSHEIYAQHGSTDIARNILLRILTSLSNLATYKISLVYSFILETQREIKRFIDFRLQARAYKIILL